MTEQDSDSILSQAGAKLNKIFNLNAGAGKAIKPGTLGEGFKGTPPNSQPAGNLSAASTMAEAPGGIDLNANEKALEEQGDKIQFPVSTDPLEWQKFQNNIFIPVINHISPPVSFPVLLGLTSPEESEDPRNLVSVLN